MQVKTWSLIVCLMSAAPVWAQGWQGPYVGIHIGGASSDFTNQLATTPGPTGETRSMVGGVQFGYNWQHGGSVVGAEADVSLTDLNEQFPGGQFEQDLMTSLRLRAGVMQGETLVFGSLGVAWTEQETTLTGTGRQSDLTPGIMVGAGAERFLFDNVTGRVEAYYVDAPAETRNTGGTATSNGSQNVIFRAGLSLHF